MMVDPTPFDLALVRITLRPECPCCGAGPGHVAECKVFHIKVVSDCSEAQARALWIARVVERAEVPPRPKRRMRP